MTRPDPAALEQVVRQRLDDGMPWAIQPEYLRDPTMLAARSRWAGRDGRGGAGRIRAGAVEILRLHGPLGYRDELVSWLGGTDLATFQEQLATAMADAKVAAILLHVDSPGGTVWGVPETADMLAAARGQGKPIVAVSDPVAGSAAYWLASQADELVAAPSGEVGSIGVWTAHVDMHRAFEQRGIDVTLISAGRFKTEGHPFGPLGDEGKAAEQARVDDYYEQFVAAVARGRKVGAAAVRDGFGEGRMVAAGKAMAERMVDRVEPLSATMARLRAAHPPPNETRRALATSASLRVARLRLAFTLSRLPSSAGTTADPRAKASRP